MNGADCRAKVRACRKRSRPSRGMGRQDRRAGKPVARGTRVAVWPPSRSSSPAASTPPRPAFRAMPRRKQQPFVLVDSQCLPRQRDIPAMPLPRLDECFPFSYRPCLRACVEPKSIRFPRILRDPVPASRRWRMSSSELFPSIPNMRFRVRFVGGWCCVVVQRRVGQPARPRFVRGFVAN
jgi:hypothetical protein